jgi:hypothetical protein
VTGRWRHLGRFKLTPELVRDLKRAELERLGPEAFAQKCIQDEPHWYINANTVNRLKGAAA